MGGSSELGGWDGDGEAGCGGVGDCSPGTIVWVRRRNGSWWPGRILGPDELPASQIMSPRSGTPVKLLGREDASVDWYNLEKSKRVKAFRCGEFDACIERAEASQGTPIKKREKYARREDAILHALELERKQLALKFQNQSFKADGIFSKPFADMRSEFNKFSSEYYSKNDVLKPQSKYIGHKAQLPSQSLACSQQQKYLGSTRYKSKKSKKRKEATSGPHDKTKELERHFLLAGSKRKFSESLAWEASENSISNHMDDFSVKHIQGATSANSGWKDTAIKKKRLEGGVVEESLVKKLDRRRPLVQVLQSSVKSPHPFEHDNNSGAVLIEGENDPLPAIYQARRSRCIYLRTDSGDTHSHGGITSIQITSTGDDFKTESYLQQSASLSEEHTPSDFVEKHGSDYSQREYSETETEDDAELLQSGRFPAELATCDPYPLRASHKLRHVDNDDDKAAFPTYIPQMNGLEDDDGSSELGVSQWHMKGKRNSRNAPKRHVDMTGGHLWLDKSNGFINGSLHKTKGSDPKKESMEATSQQSVGQSSYQTKELNYDSDETDSVERATSHSEVNRYYGKKYPSSLKPTRDLGRSCTSFNGSADDSFKISPLNRNAGQISHLGQKAYWAGSSFYQWNHGSCLGDVGLMFDVDLKVQASYQGEHVPLVSLMSRLNGKAIVGHPIQIEILEDGSTDHLVLGGDICLEDNTSAPPVWRTGRRTAMQRVPRSNPARATLDASDEWGLLDSEWEMKPPSKKCSSPFNHQVRLAKKSISNVQRPLSSKSQKKPYKKSSSSQKIKTLSSISVGKRHHRKGGQAKVYRRPDIFGGLIKPEAVPLVTCVPAKVVFSRILEAVGRPPLAVAHRVRMASPAVREPP